MMAFLKTLMLAGVMLFVGTPSVSGDCSAGLNSVLNGHCLQNNKVPNASVLCKAIVVDVCKTVTLKNVYTTTEIKTYKLAVENKITQNVAMNGNTASAGATADATGITTSTSTTTNAEADAPLVVDGTTLATGSSSSSSSSTAAASNAPVCQTGTTLCNGNCLSTTSYQSDANNCGACGNVCQANQSCQNGVCTCNTGFGNCDSDAANGCEVNTMISTTHCGQCGQACASGQTCTNGACVDAVVPCGASSSFSGGTGTRTTSVTIGTGGNSFNFIYDAQSVPDQFTIKTPSGTVLFGPIVGGTGTCCNGFGTLCPFGATASGNNLGGVLINRPAGVSSVVVEVFAPCGGTAWGFTVGCAA